MSLHLLRPFTRWRYLEGRLAPPDLETAMPTDLRAEADRRYDRALAGS